MSGKIKSDRLKTQVEIQRPLHGYERRRTRKNVGWIDFVAKEDNDEKLLRVMCDTSSNESKLTVQSLTRTLEGYEERDFDEALLLAEAITDGAKAILEEDEDLDFISRDNKLPYTIYRLRYAIQQKTMEQRRRRCGKSPKDESDCMGYQGNETVKHYSCPVRRVSDDSDFHAERGRISLLPDDFDNLIDSEKEMAG